MTSRRNFLRMAASVGVGANMLRVPQAFAAEPPLTWRHFPTGDQGFYRAPVLLMGAKEATLLDGGFRVSDGRALTDAIQASGKSLRSIYISQSDPDYYFSLAPVRAAFPEAKVLAASATVSAIKGNVEGKLSIWGPQLKEDGPQKLSDVVIPEAFDGGTLTLEGHKIEIVDAHGLANRRYLYVPSLNAIFGGVMVFAGLHVWTADTPTQATRAAWIKNLELMAHRKAAIVVPGHMSPGSALDSTAIQYTHDYLVAFEEELGKAADSKSLVDAMSKRYPNAGLPVALQIGAKVAKGEMKWG